MEDDINFFVMSSKVQTEPTNVDAVAGSKTVVANNDARQDNTTETNRATCGQENVATSGDNVVLLDGEKLKKQILIEGSEGR